jgi:hypothetical protein
MRNDSRLAVVTARQDTRRGKNVVAQMRATVCGERRARSLAAASREAGWASLVRRFLRP